jgi:hypothetical protein
MLGGEHSEQSSRGASFTVSYWRGCGAAEHRPYRWLGIFHGGRRQDGDCRPFAMVGAIRGAPSLRAGVIARDGKALTQQTNFPGISLRLFSLFAGPVLTVSPTQLHVKKKILPPRTPRPRPSLTLDLT